MQGREDATGSVAKLVLSIACALFFGAALPNQVRAQAPSDTVDPAPPVITVVPEVPVAPEAPPAVQAVPPVQNPPLNLDQPPAMQTPDAAKAVEPSRDGTNSITASEYKRKQDVTAQKNTNSPEQLALAADKDLSDLLLQADPTTQGRVVALPVEGEEALGDELPTQERISLEEALARTIDNSYSFKAVQAQAEGAGYARTAALGQLGPTVDVRTQRGREFSSPGSIIDENTGKAVINTNHRRWDASVIMRQPIFAPGSYFSYKQQGHLADAADARREDARAQLYYTTIKAYFDLLKAYALLSFSQSYETRMDQLQDYMAKRVAGGGATKIDFDRVKGRSLSAQSAVIENRGAFESSMVSLEQLTGIRAIKLVVPEHIMPPVPATSKIAMEQVYENNPGIRAAREEITAASNELKSARSRFSPTFAIELSQARYAGAGGDNTLTIDRKAMVVMTMNILNGGSDYYYQKEIGTKFVEKSNTAADVERKVKEQLEVNYRTLTAITKRTDIARQEYQTNSKVADEFLEQLGTGSKQLIDVLDAYQQAYQSRVDFAQLLFLQSDISYQILRNSGRSMSADEAAETRGSAGPARTVGSTGSAGTAGSAEASAAAAAALLNRSK
jgi:adhesin transport system outer membrane protein